MLIVCGKVFPFPHCFPFPLSRVYEIPDIGGDPARTGVEKTHRFGNPGHGRHCQTKEVFALQIAGEQLEHFRFFSNRSNRLQDFIPHTYTTIWERVTVTENPKATVMVIKREPEDVGNQKQHFGVGCVQTGLSLESEANHHLLSCYFLLNKSQTNTTFLLHA